MNNDLQAQLAEFQHASSFVGKGPLSIALHVTRYAQEHGLPLQPETLLAPRGAQVSGLSGIRIKKILADYAIVRPFASEGGRTSRGSVDNMRLYVHFLNRLQAEGFTDLAAIEAWWIDRVKDYFASMPLVLELDSSLSVESAISQLLEQAKQRQQESPGSMYVGMVLQHLVGAKLDMLLRDSGPPVEQFGVSVADGPTSRSGDFVIGETVIHVTTSPGEALMQKCKTNLNAGLQPVIVTLFDKLEMAKGNASTLQIQRRVDFFSIEQFLTTNLYERSQFQRSKQQQTIEQLILRYNRIVDEVENDPSIRIQIGG